MPSSSTGRTADQPAGIAFIAGEPVDDAVLRRVWRDTTQSPVGTWDQPVYEQFFRTVRAVNGRLPRGRGLRVLLGDPPVDWSAITTRDELMPFQKQRDSHAAEVVRREVLDKGRKALICYGLSHLTHLSAKWSGPRTGLVQVLEEEMGQRTYVIGTLIPFAGDPGGFGAKPSRYAPGTVLPTAGSWLDDFDAALVLPAALFNPSGGTGAPSNANCGSRSASSSTRCCTPARSSG